MSNAQRADSFLKPKYQFKMWQTVFFVNFGSFLVAAQNVTVVNDGA
jgi:hypothetical protein